MEIIFNKKAFEAFLEARCPCCRCEEDRGILQNINASYPLESYSRDGGILEGFEETEVEISKDLQNRINLLLRVIATRGGRQVEDKYKLYNNSRRNKIAIVGGNHFVVEHYPTGAGFAQYI